MQGYGQKRRKDANYSLIKYFCVNHHGWLTIFNYISKKKVELHCDDYASDAEKISKNTFFKPERFTFVLFCQNKNSWRPFLV